jgi:hypothetical protein
VTRFSPLALVAALALAAAGCGGSGDDGSGGAGGGEASGNCAEATQALFDTVAERDRLFVDLQLDEAAKACESELSPGTEAECTEARADLAEAASEETPPGDLQARVDAAVAACIGATITSTLPPP